MGHRIRGARMIRTIGLSLLLATYLVLFVVIMPIVVLLDKE